MRLPYYQVDAFTSEIFGGNPAGVCLLEAWLPDGTMQSMAAEHGLAETAFLVPRGPGEYDLRWFTPTMSGTRWTLSRVFSRRARGYRRIR